MAASGFCIPPEFNDQVELKLTEDERTDATILASLHDYAPISSEKNIWAFWHSGVQNMPGWCQRNVCNWIRRSGPSWTTRVLDDLPDSPNYALKYISSDLLPESFVNNHMKGPYSSVHSADFIKGAVLFTHGGVWMDVGIILLKDLDDICWNKLADPNSPFQVATPLLFDTFTANYFIASRKNDPFMKRFHELFIYLWKDRDEYTGMGEQPLVDWAKTLDLSQLRQQGYLWDWSKAPSTVIDYTSQCLAWMRLCSINDCGTNEENFNGTKYWMNRILLIDCLNECLAADHELGFDSERLYDLLSTQRDAQSTSTEEARRLVWRLLTKSSFQKVLRLKGLTGSKSLGVLLDQSTDVDDRSGTWWELLRFGSVNYRQKREIAYVQAPVPNIKIDKHLYEP